MIKDHLVSFEDTSKAFLHKSDKELSKMHFLFSLMDLKYLTKIGSYFVKTALRYKLPVKSLLKNTLFQQFCGGESLDECEKVAEALSKHQIQSVLDFAEEGERSENAYQEAVGKILEVIDIAANKTYIPFAVFKVSAIGSAKLLSKAQQGEVFSDEEHDLFQNISLRLEVICRSAFEKNVKIMIDAEESWIQGAIDVLAYSMMSKYNKVKPLIYNTFQMYRSDMPANLKGAIELARADKFYLGVKLVRGAYLELERETAKKKGQRSPLWDSKAETDLAFNEALELLVRNLDVLAICSGTHNEESNYYLVSLMKKYNIANGDERVYFSQLYGMGEHISFNLAASGYNVAKYIPFGPVASAVPYLLRRAEENKAMLGQSSRELKLIKKEMKRRKMK